MICLAMGNHRRAMPPHFNYNQYHIQHARTNGQFRQQIADWIRHRQAKTKYRA